MAELESWERLFAAICSAVADSTTEAQLSLLGMELDNPERWPWLIYALCCGSADKPVLATISWGELTEGDMLVIAAVLQTNYPLPILDSDSTSPHQYGFLDIQKGAKIRLCGVSDDKDNIFVVSSSCRCRALYDPADSEWVNVIVPGYGACKAKLGGDIRFTPDSGNSDIRKKRLSVWLEIDNVTIETPAVLIDLLTLVTRGLRKLNLFAPEVPTPAAIQVDLCALSTA
ncbi:hypothetical protein ON010_g2247 [Phytophthora cinnamomi]|nr:hypothetical protein ON010_g2247 [Phytophthora cinnamomi]